MITIRRFSSNDGQAVKDLILTVMDQEFHESKTAYPVNDLDDINVTYGGIGDAFFVAMQGEKVVGTVAVKKEDERIALLRRLFVAASYRKRQIGLKLLDRALQFCQEAGYEEIIFRTTSKMEGAAKICQKCGFIPREKLALGDAELLKFTLSLRNGHKRCSQS